MLILECPYCGVKAEETELSAGGEAHLKRFGPGASDAEFESYMFARKTLKGLALKHGRTATGQERSAGSLAVEFSMYRFWEGKFIDESVAAGVAH